MPADRTTPEQVKLYFLEKQQNEIELVWALLAVFNTNQELMGPLRQMASLCIDELIVLRRGSPEGNRAVARAWQGEVGKNKALIKYKTLTGLLNSVPTLDAQECSDVIRLYGEVVEKAQGIYAGMDHSPKGFMGQQQNPLEKYDQLNAQKSEKRVGGNNIWGPGRSRTRGNGALPGHFDSSAKAFINSMKGGISGSKLNDASTVLKVDRVFGLMEAADISGTTTDSIFFIQRYAQLFESQFGHLHHLTGDLTDPIYQLLALATLVSGGHHSLLESALSLTLNSQITGIEYRIGVYSSLLPRNSHHPGRAALLNTLRLYENNHRNRKFFAYYQGNQIHGCLLYQGMEEIAFAALTKADARLLNVFRILPSPWPDKNAVDGIIRSLAYA